MTPDFDQGILFTVGWLFFFHIAILKEYNFRNNWNCVTAYQIRCYICLVLVM